MASIFTSNLMNFIMPIFVFIFVYAISYALLSSKKFLGENKGVHAIISLVFAFFISTTSINSAFLQEFIPTVVLVMVVIVFLLLLSQLFGFGDKEFITNIFGTEKSASWFVFIVIIIILVSILSNIYGPALLQQGPSAGNQSELTEEDQFRENLMKSFFNEKVLGLVLIFLVAFFAMKFISNT
ncbi:MAG TPA: hypothetical protein ENN46_03310 [Candidatus Woesearchaeota archaeon]|nr:hypothetical protein [Candidatus Woesearchaeota archaeon]